MGNVRRIVIALLALFHFAATVAQEPETVPNAARPVDRTRVYKELADGPHGVDTIEIEIASAHRAAPLTLRAFFPRRVDRYPVIVFSHGLNLSHNHYMELARYWAGHGYVVLHPRHVDVARPPASPETPMQQKFSLTSSSVTSARSTYMRRRCSTASRVSAGSRR